MGERKFWFSKLFSSDADVDKSVLEYFNEGAEDYNRFAFSKARKKFEKAFEIATDGSVMQRVAAAGEAMARSGGNPGGEMTLCSSELQEDVASCVSEFAMLNILNTMRQDGWGAALEPTETSFEVSAVKGKYRYTVRAFGMFGTVSGNGERIAANGERYGLPNVDNPPAIHDDYVVRTLRSAVKLELPIAGIQGPLPEDFGHCPPHLENTGSSHTALDAPTPSDPATADLLAATVDLTNQTLAVLIYRTALRIHEIVRAMQGGDWAVEALDITVSSLKGDLKIGDATPLMMAPAAPQGSDLALGALIGNFRLSASALGKYEVPDDLIDIFVEAVTDADSIADIVRTESFEKLSQLTLKDALVLRELSSSSENASTSDMVKTLGDLWSPAESGHADSIAIKPSHIAVLVDGESVDESSFRSTITPKLCELTNLSKNEIAERYQIQVLRGSKEEVDRISSKQEVGIVVAMELSISLGIPDIGTLYSDGKLKSSEHFLSDCDAGLRYGLVVLYDG